MIAETAYAKRRPEGRRFMGFALPGRKRLRQVCYIVKNPNCAAT